MWYLCMVLNAAFTTFLCWTQDTTVLARVYVTVNAYRSVCPVKVIERECLAHCSCPFTDRAAATIAELCFAKQLSDSLPQPTWILLYVWAAQLCCWYAVITKDNLFHVYEETLWLLVGFTYFQHSTGNAKRVAALYCFYMAFIDIPMYAERFLDMDPVSLLEGIKDVVYCSVVDDWPEEHTWRTGYFVGASHLSMYL